MRTRSAAVAVFTASALAAFAACHESNAPAGPVAAPPSTFDASVAVQASSAPQAPPAPPVPQFPADWPYPRGPAGARSERGMVTSDAALATKVGADVLASGGNAIDAVVAAQFALAVVFPTAGNVGGGGFMVARVGGQSYALDFRETAPATATRDMYLGPDRKPTKDTRDGWRSSGVPGSVAGLWEAWHKLGSHQKAWAELLAPAIDLADHGFEVDPGFAKMIDIVKARLAKYPASTALFLPDGGPPAVGSHWRDPDLAKVLRRIAKDGPAGFYEGPTADAIARAMKDNGGLLTAADLKSYRAQWRQPIEYEYRRKHVVGMPPPSSGGITMAMIAHLVEGWDVRALGWHSAAHVHLVAEAMRRAFAARNAKLGDPDYVKNPIEELLSDDWARSQRATIRMDRATTAQDLFPDGGAPIHEGPHTTHMSIVDPAGNAVALTTTINLWFGSGVTVPGLGFVLNDEMDDFATVPGSANSFGLVQGEPNAVGAKKRMLSSMSPTIVLGPDGDVEMVLGAAGGSRIITTVFEELSNAIDFGMSIGDAVRAPRFHQQDLPELMLVEPHSLPDDVRHALTAMGHELTEADHIGDGPGIARDGKVWEGAAEPRREGSEALGL
jgi:gamma-glutamyltranspeptidase/glutathione hydrolase